MYSSKIFLKKLMLFLNKDASKDIMLQNTSNKHWNKLVLFMSKILTSLNQPKYLYQQN